MKTTDQQDLPGAHSTPGAPTPYPATENESGRSFIRRHPKAIIVSIIVAVMVLALGGAGMWTYSYAESVDASHQAASRALATAVSDLESARAAAILGTADEDELLRIETEIESAKAHLAAGSFFDRSSYDKASEAAKAASKRARVIVARMEDMAQSARSLLQAGNYDEAITAYFTMYECYPATSEGGKALERAADALRLKLGEDRNGLPALLEICSFCSECPGDTPPSVVTMAREGLIDLAGTSLQSQRTICSRNQAWADAMLGEGKASDDLMGTYSPNTSKLSDAIEIIPTLGVDEGFVELCGLLRDASKLGEELTGIEESPIKTSGSMQTYSTDQVKRVDSLCKQIKSKLDKAETLLASL